jgi:hypothetical protein
VTWQSGLRQMQKLQSLCTVMKKSWLMKNGEIYDTHEAYDARSDSEGNSDESCKRVIPTLEYLRRILK